MAASSLEIFSSHSLCFMSNLTAQNTSQRLAGHCFSHWCQDGTLYVKLRNTEWMECPYGGFIQVRGRIKPCIHFVFEAAFNHLEIETIVPIK